MSKENPLSLEARSDDDSSNDAPQSVIEPPKTDEEAQALVSKMFKGEITVDNDITKTAADFATVITVNDLGNLK